VDTGLHKENAKKQKDKAGEVNANSPKMLEIHERDEVYAGDLLNIALVAFCDSMGKGRPSRKSQQYRQHASIESRLFRPATSRNGEHGLP
jgi:hypothetical protein